MNAKYEYLFEGVPECWHPILKIDFLNIILDAVVDLPNLSPPPHLIFAAFQHIKNLDDLKVIIIGQDPYIKPGEAMGLSFSVPAGVKVPPSLANIYKAIMTSYPKGPQEIINGDLTSWAQQGVLLLNAALTTTIGTSNAHAELWQKYTDYILTELVKKTFNFSMVLWGNFAQGKARLVPPQVAIFKWKHPSPMADSSAQIKFAQCDNFINVNKHLLTQGRDEIIWHLGTQQPDMKAARRTIAPKKADLPRTIVIFTDGAASGNGKSTCTAGWGIFVPAAPFCLADGIQAPEIGYTEEIKLNGAVRGTDTYPATNNRAEFAGIYAALSWCISKKIEHDILIVSDSQYCIGTLTSWAPSWIDKNILEEKKNPDLVLATLNLLKQLPKVKFLHMRGHSKDTAVCKAFIDGNNVADELATTA